MALLHDLRPLLYTLPRATAEEEDEEKKKPEANWICFAAAATAAAAAELIDGLGIRAQRAGKECLRLRPRLSRGKQEKQRENY